MTSAYLTEALLWSILWLIIGWTVRWGLSALDRKGDRS